MTRQAETLVLLLRPEVCDDAAMYLHASLKAAWGEGSRDDVKGWRVKRILSIQKALGVKPPARSNRAKGLRLKRNEADD
ncbi:hypothetical protein GCM10010201_28160 [Pilimelia columellifera subsp. columellifera]|uniref:Uncharacterized protein n=1 Tax=Pilimelia columellifera subsp. columellifera TaxID=706583 RepID=A0ABN3NPH1_9ACTN